MSEDFRMDPRFYKWAFGCDINARVWGSRLQLMEAWNKLHGEELKLEPNGLVDEDSFRMYELWHYKGMPDGMD